MPSWSSTCSEDAFDRYPQRWPHPCSGMRAAELRAVTYTHLRAKLRANLAIVILTVSLVIDIVMDQCRRAAFFHAFVEGSAIIAAAVGVVLGAQRLRNVLYEAQDLREQSRIFSSTLSIMRHEAECWRRKGGAFLSGVLPKRLEHKEIPELRNISEMTVRQQARSVDRKSNLSGCHDLAAVFLEDLLAPRSASAANASSDAFGRSR